MLLKKVKILNYRQLHDIDLDFQNTLTVLAGPNNSGKTTLISVLKGMFSEKKLSLNYSDIPIHLSTQWVNKVFPVFQTTMLTQGKAEGINAIIKKLSVDDSFNSDFVVDSFQAQIQVDYEPENDNIQLFSDYLMDLDDTKHSFYFIYTYEPHLPFFEKALGEYYDKMATRFQELAKPECLEKETKTYFLKERLLKLYCGSLIEKCYFCNSNFKIKNPMDITAFKKLFNFQSIPAIREVDDEKSDSSKGISKRVIALLKDDAAWADATKNLPDMLMAQIDSSGVKTQIKNSSIKSLDETVKDISKTSGGHIGSLQLEIDVSEDDVEDFIQKITRAKYDIDGLLLNEESQGLGFSNLIYLHMRLEEFCKTVEKDKVNVFFIEEPESHMHPQMQNVFIRFLKNYYSDKQLQGLITTHSNEIARTVGLESLRVIRETRPGKSELFNLNQFRKSLKDKKVKNTDEGTEFLLTNFFDWFFEIGYSELIFADKVILYEGDTERLYIRKLISKSAFASLGNSYIAFIQVGGAYALNYLDILTSLKMKTLIITDLDYDNKAKTFDLAKKTKSTNATLNHCYRILSPQSGDTYKPSIEELFSLQESENIILSDGLIYLAFQDKNSTARTLEEAMLSKLLGISVFTPLSRTEWKIKRKNSKLTFTIPDNTDEDKASNKESNFTIRRIVEATTNSKTDFMYSVILSGKEEIMLPDYIKKGLLWLAN